MGGDRDSCGNQGMERELSVAQPRPQGFSLKKIKGFSLFPPHPFFKGKALRTRLSVAASTGTRGGGWGDRNFLHRNAGKMTTIEAKHEILSRETAKHHTCPEDAEHGRM